MVGYVGEVRIFAGNYAPLHWAFCNGQMMTVAENAALFSLIGTFYGGDGRTTFALPDLRGRIPIGMGSGPTLTPRGIGQSFGQETVTLNLSELPAHTHSLQASGLQANSKNVNNSMLAETTVGDEFYAEVSKNPQTRNLANDTILPAGDGQAHDNWQPVQGVNYIICLVGAYPSRN